MGSDGADQWWIREQEANSYPSLKTRVVVALARALCSHPPVGPNANDFSVSLFLAQIFLKCTLLVHT